MPFNEALLDEMRERPMPEELRLIDDKVISGVRERQQMVSVSRTALGACGIIALGIGLASGAMTSAPAIARESQMALTSASALAPSNLLDGGE